MGNENIKDSHSSDDSDSEANYDNCIVLRRDSDEYGTSDEELELILPETNDNCDANLTCDKILNSDLNKDDIIAFLFGMLNKVKAYLNNLTEDKHKAWLIDKISLMEAVAFKEFQRYEQEAKSNCVSNDNSILISDLPSTSTASTSVISDCSEYKEKFEEFKKPAPKKLSTNSKKSINKDKLEQKLNKELNKPKIVSKDDINRTQANIISPNKKIKILANQIIKVGKQDGECDLDLSENNDNMKLKKNSPVNRRVSHRLQELKEGKELVYCDKLTYFSLNLPSTLSTPVTPVENPTIKRKYTKRTDEEKKKLKADQLSRKSLISGLKNKNKLSKSLTDLISKHVVTELNSTELNQKRKRGRPKSLTNVTTVTTPKNLVTKLKSTNQNEKRKRGRPKSLSATRVGNLKSKFKKRKDPSLEHCFRKKAKSDDNKRDSYAGSSSSNQSSPMKKKLYSPDEWLLSFQKECEQEGF